MCMYVCVCVCVCVCARSLDCLESIKNQHIYLCYVVVVQSLCCHQLFANLWSAVCLAFHSQSFTISQSLLKLMSIESVMLSNHLILCHPVLPLDHDKNRYYLATTVFGKKKSQYRIQFNPNTTWERKERDGTQWAVNF